MMMQSDFNEQQELDNAAILRQLSCPLIEYGQTQYAEWCYCKALELRKYVLDGYADIMQWLSDMARKTGNLDYIRWVDLAEKGEIEIYQMFYHWLLSESERRLLVGM